MTVSLDCIDHDPDIGWLIHYRARDPITITMLHDIAAGDPGPSDPIELGISHCPSRRRGIAERVELGRHTASNCSHILSRIFACQNWIL